MIAQKRIAICLSIVLIHLSSQANAFNFTQTPTQHAQTNPSQNTLPPPWYALLSELQNVLGADPCVEVKNIEDDTANMKINIHVCEADKAKALARLIKHNYDFGNINVTVRVYSHGLISEAINTPTTSAEQVSLIEKALSDNPYFFRAGTIENTPITFIEFKPSVIHYFNDDISDLYAERNMAAVQAFNEILDLGEHGSQYRIVTGTARE